MSELTLVQYNNQRVLTTRQLADVYEVETTALVNNFNKNKKHFTEGVHYYHLKGDELKAFKNYISQRYVVQNDNMTNNHSVNNDYPIQGQAVDGSYDIVPKRTPHLYLWTERGANRHCKILDTAKAWEQFDNLEDTYFRVKELIQNKFAIPQTFSEALRLAAQIQEENERLLEQEKLLLPKATGYDLIVDNKGTQSMNEFAKSMNWGRNRLYNALREHDIFIKDTTTPKQQYVNQKYFIVKQCRKGNMVFPVTFITTKGIDYLVRKVEEWGIARELLDYGLIGV